MSFVHNKNIQPWHPLLVRLGQLNPVWSKLRKGHGHGKFFNLRPHINPSGCHCVSALSLSLKVSTEYKIQLSSS